MRTSAPFSAQADSVPVAVTDVWHGLDTQRPALDRIHIGGHLNEQLCIEYLDWCARVRHRSVTTVRTYGSTLQAYVDHLGPIDLRCTEQAVMEAFVTRPRQRRGQGTKGAPATQRKDTAILRSLYRWLWERGHCDDLAKGLHGPTVHNVNPKPVSDADWMQLWASDDLSPSSRVALGLGYWCGLRRAEIVGLRCAQVTPSQLVEMRRKGGSTHNLPWAEMLQVYVDALPHLADGHERFVRSLRELSQGRGDDPLLRWASTSPDAMNKRMRSWCRRAGITQITPHQLRHSCATNLLRAGVPVHLVSRLLGHANLTTTMVYVQAGGSELREWRVQQRHGAPTPWMTQSASR